MTARSRWEVVALVRPWRIRVAVIGSGYEMDEIATLSPGGSGTLASFVDAVRPTSLGGRVMVALAGGILRRDLDRRARLLKAALEGVSGPSTPGLTLLRPNGDERMTWRARRVLGAR